MVLQRLDKAVKAANQVKMPAVRLWQERDMEKAETEAEDMGPLRQVQTL